MKYPNTKTTFKKRIQIKIFIKFHEVVKGRIHPMIKMYDTGDIKYQILLFVIIISPLV